jgi:hypothetical protein
VNHRDIRIEVYSLGVLPIALYVRVVHVRRETLFHPLQRIMEALCYPVERFRSGHDLPPGSNPEFFEQRDQTMQDLGDTAAETRRVHVQHALPFKQTAETL